MEKSIEPLVETWAREQISKLGWKNAPEQIMIDKQLTESLNKHLSKQGGIGSGRPDHTLLIDNGEITIPVFIEHKGKKNYTVNTDKQNLVILKNEKGQWDFKKSISKYAVNGAAYYASCAIQDSFYDEIIAIGTNGWVDSTGKIIYEVLAYLITKSNSDLPILLGRYSDLSFLNKSNISKFLKHIEEKNNLLKNYIKSR